MIEIQQPGGSAILIDAEWRIGIRRPGRPDMWVPNGIRKAVLALRDRELGRWRDSRYPDRVVYPRRDLDDAHGRAVCVLDETTGEDVLCWEQLTQDGAARAYFAAHPARHPGCDADPGAGVPGD